MDNMGNTSTSISIGTQKARNRAKKNISAFLEKEGFIEVETPVMSRTAIPESSISLFETTRTRMSGDDKFYLLPSPELYMKRILFEWRESIFQFSKAFRNSEQTSKQHANEFTMLEYYKVGEDEIDQANRTERMLARLWNASGAERWDADSGSVSDGFRIMTMAEAVKSATNLDLDSLQSTKSLRRALSGIRINVYDENESWADSFNRLFVSVVEPKLPCQDKPLLLHSFPSQIECLAKEGNGGTKRRWELYFKGIELANCYMECASRDEIENYLVKEDKLIQAQKPEFRSDYALADFSPLPRCSGVALGFDRLMMVFLGKNEMRAVTPFYDCVS